MVMKAHQVNFRQKDVSRAIRAARIAGIDVDKVEVDPKTSKITITAKTPNAMVTCDSEKADP
jgi:hypothetical protein